MKYFMLLFGRFVFTMARPFWKWYFPRRPRTRAILTHKGKILLVKGWLGDGSWSLPGGGLHKNETFMNGAIREINEELSLKLSENQLRLLGEIKVFKNNYYVKLVVFKCALERLPTINVRKTEIAEITWANKADLNILPLTISTRAILARWSKQR